MKKTNAAEALEQLLKEDSRYTIDAYHFIRDALEYTTKMLNKPAQGAQRHVTGGELLDGIRKYALNEFGPMAKTVFTAWGIRACADFGQLVFNLVNKGILGKTDQDTLQDFTHGYDFDAAFCAPYRPEPTADVKYRECP